MIETFNFHGREVVAHTDSQGGELVEHHIVYFQKFIRAYWAGNVANKPLWVDADDHTPFVDWWFEQEKEVLWEVVLKYFNWRGLVSKNEIETKTVHELITRGSSSNERALVPWNMIPLIKENHDSAHRHQGITIHRFDPLDDENGLVVLDVTNHKIDNADMWFYNRPEFEATNNANTRRRLVMDWAQRRIQEDWKIAPVLAVMRAEKDYKALGEPSHKALLSGMQHDQVKNEEKGIPEDKHFYVSTGICNSLEAALKLAIEGECVEQAMFLEPDKAAKIMRRIEDPKTMREFLTQVSYLSQADFDYLWKLKYKKAPEPAVEHRDAIEAVCECGAAHLKVHRHVLEGSDDQFGMEADYTVDNGEAVHTDGANVVVVIDEKDGNDEQDKEEIAV